MQPREVQGALQGPTLPAELGLEVAWISSTCAAAIRPSGRRGSFLSLLVSLALLLGGAKRWSREATSNQLTAAPTGPAEAGASRSLPTSSSACTAGDAASPSPSPSSSARSRGEGKQHHSHWVAARAGGRLVVGRKRPQPNPSVRASSGAREYELASVVYDKVVSQFAVQGQYKYKETKDNDKHSITSSPEDGRGEVRRGLALTPRAPSRRGARSITFCRPWRRPRAWRRRTPRGLREGRWQAAGVQTAAAGGQNADRSLHRLPGED